MKKIFLILFCLFVSFKLNSKITFVGTVKKDKDCLALLSLARDKYFDSGHKVIYKKLTKLQNDIYLKYPSGHFTPKHIETEKFLHIQRIKKQGKSYLDDELINCGYK